MQLDRQGLEAFSDAAGAAAMATSGGMPRVEQRHLDRFEQLKAARAAKTFGNAHTVVSGHFAAMPCAAAAMPDR